jgi:glycosyltransferase involved in cell wall biosynthesis
MRVCAIVPAFQAERRVGEVIRGLGAVWPTHDSIFVLDDGSTDRTAEIAREAGARVVCHGYNRGKGAAIRSGLQAAQLAGFEVAVTVDADGQHPASEAARLASATLDPSALVLGVRDLASAGAPRPSQMSNRISNFFLSAFSGRPLADTQCGLRRYPIAATLDLDGRDNGYAFEAEIVLRAIAAGMTIVEIPIECIYPPKEERISHFDSVRDPWRIIQRVVKTLVSTGGMRHAAMLRVRSHGAGSRRDAAESLAQSAHSASPRTTDAATDVETS